MNVSSPSGVSEEKEVVCSPAADAAVGDHDAALSHGDGLADAVHQRVAARVEIECKV
jgi:hypothetical protein